MIADAKFHPLLLALAVLLSRLPFLFDGYGHEEDSYGLVVNAWEMHSYGHYVASRFPGHPLQEYIYLLIWDQPAWLWNLLSALLSVTAVLAFHHAIKGIGLKYAMEASLLFAFTPMFFIAGTYTIDYAWSLAFVMLSFSSLVCRKFWLSGIMLGLAVGCRVTSGVFVLPWALLLWQNLDVAQWRIYVVKIIVPCAIIGVLWYIPAYLQYGRAFFDYSDQFPYPSFAKIFYKATIGVFGILGILGLIIAFVRWATQKEKQAVNPPAICSPARLVWVVVLIVVLHIVSYLRLPQKAGYMLPIVPFVVLLVVMYIPRNTLRIITLLFLLAPFLFGMNITDELRGSGATGASVKFNVNGQEISIDAARGLAFAEQQKRRNKMEYVQRVCDHLDNSNEKQVLVCGWWYNEVITERRLDGASNADHIFLFYSTCAALRDYEADGFTIYYLPEQDLYNDQMFGQSCTNEIAQPFPVQ